MKVKFFTNGNFTSIVHTIAAYDRDSPHITDNSVNFPGFGVELFYFQHSSL